MTIPAQAQVHSDASSSALTPLIVTRAAPGVHGCRTGRQGTGLTPVAMAVGFSGEEHVPNDGMFATVTSVITPAGVVADTSTLDALKTAVAAPKVHCTSAPVETCSAMSHLRECRKIFYNERTLEKPWTPPPS